MAKKRPTSEPEAVTEASAATADARRAGEGSDRADTDEAGGDPNGDPDEGDLDAGGVDDEDAPIREAEASGEDDEVAPTREAEASDEASGGEDAGTSRVQASEHGTSRGSAPAVVAGGSWPKKAVEWLTRSEALREATAAQPTTAGAVLRARASAAKELAERAAAPDEPLRRGSGDAVAIDLYRQAIYWLLVSSQAGPPASDPPEAWGRADRGALRAVAESEEELEAVAHLVRLESFIATAALEDAAAARARLARFVGRLFEQHDVEGTRVARLQVQRFFRLGVLAALLGTGAWFGWQALSRPDLADDLARGAPFTTSSKLSRCTLTDGTCRGKKVSIFFHTNQEKQPWVQYDLGAPKEISAVEIVNRSDCCQNRAVPLVVEVSDDRKSWRQVAKQTKPFGVLLLPVERATGRFVRFRAESTTTLHFERVSIFP